MTTWDADYQRGGGRHWPNEMLVSWVTKTYGHRDTNERKRTRFLEVGCGVGGNLRFLADEGFDATGVDLSESAVVQCCARGFTAVVANVLDLGNLRPEFDCILDVTCLQHLTEYEHFAALEGLRMLTREGGRFWSYRLGFGTHYERIFPAQPPAWLATKEALVDQFHGAGWSETTILEHNREYPKALWARYLMVEART